MLPRTPSYRLDGKRAVVIGGSRGIGLGCAVALAEQGASVVIVARSKGQVFETVNEMKSEGFSVSGAPTDVSIIDNVKNLMGEYSDIDILVNCGPHDDPNSHTIVGDIKSPTQTKQLVETSLAWIKSL